MLAAEITAAMTSLRPPQQVHCAGDVALALADTLRCVGETDARFDDTLFRYDARTPPHVTGAALAAAYANFAAGNGPSPVTMLAHELDRLGVTPDFPERKAAMVAAVLAAVSCGNRFHNGNHSREVLGNAIWLSRTNAVLVAIGASGAAPLNGVAVARLLLAATMHDIGHDGTANIDGDGSYIPYRLEDRAQQLMRSVLQRAGMTRESIDGLQVMLRATDPRARAAVRGLTDHVLDGLPLQADVPNEFAGLLDDPALALSTALLCDADVMSSVGLTYDYYRRMSASLAAERGTTISEAETRTFFFHIVGDGFASAAGKRLDPNLWHIRAAVLGA